MKQELLNYFFISNKIPFVFRDSITVNLGEIACGCNSDNEIDYIQMWFNELGLIVSYERYSDNDWEFCVWQGCPAGSQEKLNRSIVEALMVILKRSHMFKTRKVLNMQLRLF